MPRKISVRKSVSMARRVCFSYDFEWSVLQKSVFKLQSPRRQEEDKGSSQNMTFSLTLPNGKEQNFLGQYDLILGHSFQ